MATRRAGQGSLSLRLYVAGNAPNSARAHANIRAICEGHFAEHYTLEVVDMLADPRRALADAIIVTPTLLKLEPEPALRVIGDLGNTAEVLLLLGAK